MLIAARVLQGIGGSMLNPVAMSIIRNVFLDPRERAQAIGSVERDVISMGLGPVLGGVLVDGRLALRLPRERPDRLGGRRVAARSSGVASGARQTH